MYYHSNWEELHFWERNISRENTHTHTQLLSTAVWEITLRKSRPDTSLIKTNVNHTHFSSFQPCKNPLHAVPLQPSSSSCIQLINDTHRTLSLIFRSKCTCVVDVCNEAVRFASSVYGKSFILHHQQQSTTNILIFLNSSCCKVS